MRRNRTVYAINRYYSPDTGRFTTHDPLTELDRPERLNQPQGLNLYPYVMGGPTRYTDPDGRDWIQYQSNGNWRTGWFNRKPKSANEKAVDLSSPVGVAVEGWCRGKSRQQWVRKGDTVTLLPDGDFVVTSKAPTKSAYTNDVTKAEPKLSLEERQRRRQQNDDFDKRRAYGYFDPEFEAAGRIGVGLVKAGGGMVVGVAGHAVQGAVDPIGTAIGDFKGLWALGEKTVGFAGSVSEHGLWEAGGRVLDSYGSKQELYDDVAAADLAIASTFAGRGPGLRFGAGAEGGLAGNSLLGLESGAGEAAAAARTSGAAGRGLPVLEPHFVPDPGKVLQNITTSVNQELAAAPSLAKTVLSPAEYASAQRAPWLANMQYGNALV